ncbi:MAG: DUF2723 domain-containing protein [Muribaculaceae bacterium]|nr:DUF2723 domain-containing protein [Muribaculaceae bacterium]
MKRYNLINNLLGWVCFVIAAATYLLTIEPTASFWDCPEFIAQGVKLEVGHPPGNPIFMLAARFFVNFAGGDLTLAAAMVNSMSALLSAGTILLLFWTITHLVKRLIVKDEENEVSLTKMLLIFGSGICGSLCYTWSDTFWFSAVEGEVYAFSSFCTALVFWLILKWENRADRPHSDKYLVLIAYVIGISIAVHLLNLLCIPAIVLVVYYRKWKNTNVKGSLIALAVSVVIVAMILYGLVPGFIEMSQYFELLCVNTLGMSFNTGVMIYAVLLVGTMIWAVAELYRQQSALRIKVSFGLAIFLSGMLFIGDKLWVAFLLTAALVGYLIYMKRVPVRVLNVIALSVMVIFVGYSSYALLLIRSAANPPMDQNSPDNVFSLSSYLNREQYGESPLFYGQTLNSSPVYELTSAGTTIPLKKEGPALYAKEVKTSPDEPDRYKKVGNKFSYVMTPELNMLFPRIYSSAHAAAYSDWIGGLQGRTVNATQYVDSKGDPIYPTTRVKPTMAENMRYFLNYQLNHMYWRYFMWNFAGRQNDIQGNGEVNHGNWISGIPFIDNARLGDQSLLPWDLGKGNKGHNVFFMLPLLMGIIGLLWQAFHSKRGIEQFWVIFFLFFMTGIAIVLYLNQPPSQPRERDYAFAGSFYAFAIWVGMGVAGLYYTLVALTKKKDKKPLKDAAANVQAEKAAAEKPAAEKPAAAKKEINPLVFAAIAAIVGLAVPLQMVSQTWDDHDRSGRTAARDFGMNYLNSLDPNAIIFTNGDNDTFPLWYAQEVEGVRTDVKVVNLSYLTTDWYVNQQLHPSYEAHGIEIQARPEDYAYDRLQFSYFTDIDSVPVNVLSALAELYSPKSTQNDWGLPVFRHPVMFIPSNAEAAAKAGVISPDEVAAADENIIIDFTQDPYTRDGITLSKAISLDILATGAKNGWKRPVYFAMTVPEDYYMGLQPYMRNTGMAYQITPIGGQGSSYNLAVDTDKAYRNITEKFRWGGLDKIDENPSLYLDETVRRMVTTTRSAMLDLAVALVNEAVEVERMDSIPVADRASLTEFKNDRYAKALTIINLMEEKLPEKASPYSVQIPLQLANLYYRIGLATNNKKAIDHALEIYDKEIERAVGYVLYYQSLPQRLYRTLPRTDQYIHQMYLIDLLGGYQDAGGDVETKLSDLQKRGVDFNRMSY